MKELIEECETSSESLQFMCRILDEGAQEGGDAALADLNSKVAKVFNSVESLHAL